MCWSLTESVKLPISGMRQASRIACAQDATIKGFLPSNEALQGGPGGTQVLPLGSLARRGIPDITSSAADAHCSTVHALAMCRGYLCSAGGDAMIRVWDAATLKLHRQGPSKGLSTASSECQMARGHTLEASWNGWQHILVLLPMSERGCQPML